LSVGIAFAFQVVVGTTEPKFIEYPTTRRQLCFAQGGIDRTLCRHTIVPIVIVLLARSFLAPLKGLFISRTSVSVLLLVYAGCFIWVFLAMEYFHRSLLFFQRAYVCSLCPTICIRYFLQSSLSQRADLQ